MKTWLIFWLALLGAVFAMFVPSVCATEIVVGVYQNAPLVFTDNNGTPKGVFIDILEEIAKKETWTIRYRPGSWTECLARLSTGEIDLLVGIADSYERRKYYDYPTEPVLSNWGTVYTREDVEFASIMDLSDQKVAALKEDIYYAFFQRFIAQFQIFPQYVEVETYEDILQLLDSGEVDAGILPRIYASYHEKDLRITKSPLSFSPVDLHFAVSKGKHAELISALNRHLPQLKANKNSIYYKSLDVRIEGVNRFAFPKWMNPIVLFAIVVGFITLILGGNMILRWKISLKSRELEEMISAKERIQSELRLAHEIQMESVPTIFPAFPDRTEFDIFAVLEPAREVGGDFYDFFFLNDTELCFIIGDVSGKGVPAALFMSAVKTLLKAMAKHIHDPARLLAAVNQEFAPENESCTFVTIFCGVLNVRTGVARYTNAGHNPPVLLRQGKSAEFLVGTKSTLVGVDEDAVYHEAAVSLSPGDSLCLYTDGVTEAFAPDNRMFSEERLLQEIVSFPQDSMNALVGSILRQVQDFAGNMPQADDMTLLALRFLGDSPHDDISTGNRKRLRYRITNDLLEIRRIMSLISDVSQEHGFSSELTHDLCLVLEEVLSNVMLHGYADESEHLIDVEIAVEGLFLSLEIRDDGLPFDPLAVSAPDLEIPLEAREIGGLGIYLTRTLMDEMTYAREGEYNVLRMKKVIAKNDKEIR